MISSHKRDSISSDWYVFSIDVNTYGALEKMHTPIGSVGSGQKSSGGQNRSVFPLMKCQTQSQLSDEPHKSRISWKSIGSPEQYELISHRDTLSSPAISCILFVLKVQESRCALLA